MYRYGPPAADYLARVPGHHIVAGPQFAYPPRRIQGTTAEAEPSVVKLIG